MERNKTLVTWISPHFPARYGERPFANFRRTCRNPGIPHHRQNRVISRRAPCMTRTESQNAASSVPPDWNGKDIDPEILIREVKFNSVGLVPAVTQQWDTGEVLMMAWMSAESIRETMRGGRAVYYSRSRKQLWRKGDTSGQVQKLHDILLDCDGDTILLAVDQLGVACHTGRRSCFFMSFRPPNGEMEIVKEVLIDPDELYKGVK